jgi:capsular polysaccharide biosynthesis protein
VVISVTGSIISIKLPPEISFLPNIYTLHANMLINDDSSAGGIAAAINASGLGGLASMAGINVGGSSSFSNLVMYLVNSDTLLDSVVEKFDLARRYKIKKYAVTKSREALKEKLKARYNGGSGILTISFSDYDPYFARDVINYCVDYLNQRLDSLLLDKNLQQKEKLEKNIAAAYESMRALEKETRNLELPTTGPYNAPAPDIPPETRRANMELEAQQQTYTQLKTQLELINTAIANKTPIIQVFEAARIPELKSGPSRGTICIIVILGAFFFSVFLAFVLAALENIRNDPEAMEKFRAVNKSTTSP